MIKSISFTTYNPRQEENSHQGRKYNKNRIQVRWHRKKFTNASDQTVIYHQWSNLRYNRRERKRKQLVWISIASPYGRNCDTGCAALKRWILKVEERAELNRFQATKTQGRRLYWSDYIRKSALVRNDIPKSIGSQSRAVFKSHERWKEKKLATPKDSWRRVTDKILRRWQPNGTQHTSAKTLWSAIGPDAKSLKLRSFVAFAFNSTFWPHFP